MSRGTRSFSLLLLTVLWATMLIVVVSDAGLARDPRPPADSAELAAWLTQHPADWVAASALSDYALDSPLPRRFEIWRAAHSVAQHLAPLRPNAIAAFVRGGLFHWYELPPADRQAVLDAAVPLMHDESFFGDLHRPLWQLTHDFAYLRRNAPDTLNALDQLRRLAAHIGLFAEYREAREAMQRKQLEIFQQQRATMRIGDMLLLARSPDAGDEPLLRGILEELHRRSFDASEMAGFEPLIIYAIEHHLQPLDGLGPLVQRQDALTAPTRARLALALNDPSAAKGIEISSAMIGAPEWLPYHIERALFDARRGDRAATLAQVQRALHPTPTMAGLAGAQQAMSLLGDHAAATGYRNQILAIREREWRNTCSGGELCDWVSAHAYSTTGTIAVTLSPSQADTTPPYVEIYVDEARVAEGEVAKTRTFNVPASNGLHRVEVRLVNPLTRNGTQRRVRLS